MLLDTSGLVCCFDADDVRHLAAVTCYDGAAVRLTHNYVLAEFVALCQARGFPTPTPPFRRKLNSRPHAR